MRRTPSLAAAALAAILAPALSSAAPPSIGGCQVFPTNNYWNTPIDTLPVHPSSAAWVRTMTTGASGRTNLHPDWGTTEVEYGIPYVTVGAGSRWSKSTESTKTKAIRGPIRSRRTRRWKARWRATAIAT